MEARKLVNVITSAIYEAKQTAMKRRKSEQFSMRQLRNVLAKKAQEEGVQAPGLYETYNLMKCLAEKNVVEMKKTGDSKKAQWAFKILTESVNDVEDAVAECLEKASYKETEKDVKEAAVKVEKVTEVKADDETERDAESVADEVLADF